MIRLINIQKTVVFLFIIGTFGFISCAQLQFWKSEAPVDPEEVEQAEEHLTGAIEALLNVDPDTDPSEFARRISEFEEALEQYLIHSGKRDRTVVHLDYKGANIIIPLRSIDRYDNQTGTTLVDRIGTFWQRIGPEFHDEIVDIAVLPFEDDGDMAVVLFSDSLVVFSLHGQRRERNTFDIPARNKQETYTQIPAGMIEPVYENGGYTLSYMTAHMDTSLMIEIADHTSNPVESPFTYDISPVTGRPYFSFRNESVEYIFGIRHMRSDSNTVVLDNRGFLYLYTTQDDSLIWQSNRAWGNRLFRINDNEFAVTHHGDYSFSLFEIHSDTVITRGVSPRFHGQVGAVIQKYHEDTEGFLVSISTGIRRDNRHSQLHFVPADAIRWREPDVLPQPSFPDYDARFLVVDAVKDIVDPEFDHRDIHRFVRDNVYETPVKLASDGTVLYTLATSVLPDILEKRWLVNLNPGVRFSDGTLVTAEAVKDSWERNFKNCALNDCPWQWIIGAIDRIDIVDSLTIRIQLSERRTNFTEYLSAPCFRIEKSPDEHSRPIGTGPYMIHFTDRESSPGRIVFDRNPYYHGGLAIVDQITVLTRRSDIIEYITGRENTGALIRHPREVDFFGAIGAFRELKNDSKKIYFLALNPGSARLQTAASRARIVEVFDREAVLTVVTEAKSEIARSFFIRPETASREVEFSGTSPVSNSMRIFYPAYDPVAGQIAQRLAVRLQQEGIAAQRPEGVSRTRLLQLRRNGQYDLLVDSIRPVFSSPALNMYHLLNRGFFFDEAVREKAGSLLLSGEERKVSEIEHYMMAEYYLHPLIRTSFHAFIPRDLHLVEFGDAIHLDLSGAWFPIKQITE